MTHQQIIETLAQIKKAPICNLDIENGTFQCGKSIFMFELSKGGKTVKSNSVKFLYTAANFNNCSY